MVTDKEIPIRLLINFSAETLKSGQSRMTYSKFEKKNFAIQKNSIWKSFPSYMEEKDRLPQTNKSLLSITSKPAL